MGTMFRTVKLSLIAAMLGAASASHLYREEVFSSKIELDIRTEVFPQNDPYGDMPGSILDTSDPKDAAQAVAGSVEFGQLRYSKNRNKPFPYKLKIDSNFSYVKCTTARRLVKVFEEILELRFPDPKDIETKKRRLKNLKKICV